MKKNNVKMGHQIYSGSLPRKSLWGNTLFVAGVDSCRKLLVVAESFEGFLVLKK